MSKEVHYVLKRGTELTPEEISMIEAASTMPTEYDGLRASFSANC